MVYLNFNDLSEEAQTRLLENSRKDVEEKYGESIRQYIRENHTSFEKTIEEEAQLNLFKYTYVFNI